MSTIFEDITINLTSPPPNVFFFFKERFNSLTMSPVLLFFTTNCLPQNQTLYSIIHLPGSQMSCQGTRF